MDEGYGREGEGGKVVGKLVTCLRIDDSSRRVLHDLKMRGVADSILETVQEQHLPVHR